MDIMLKSPNFCWDKRALVLKYFLRIFGVGSAGDRGVRAVDAHRRSLFLFFFLLRVPGTNWKKGAEHAHLGAPSKRQGQNTIRALSLGNPTGRPEEHRRRSWWRWASHSPRGPCCG